MSELNDSNFEESHQQSEIKFEKLPPVVEDDCNVKIQDSGDDADVSSEYVCDYSHDESIKMPTVLEEEASNKTFNEIIFTYSNSNATPTACVESEYVGYEARRHGIYQTTPADDNEEQKYTTDEVKIHNPQNSDDKLSNNSFYFANKNCELNSSHKIDKFFELNHDLNSNYHSSGYKLDEDEVTIVRFTQDSIKQNISENFTGINESDQEECIGRVSTELDTYIEEDSSRFREFELCKQEFKATQDCTPSSPSEIIKMSFLSNFDNNTNSRRNLNYFTTSFSPGIKFCKKSGYSFDNQNSNNRGQSEENTFCTNPKIFSLKKCGHIKTGLSENKNILNLNNLNKGRNKNKFLLVNLDSNLSVKEVNNNDKDRKETDDDYGEENVLERPSDLYSSYRNVSVRAPRVISSLAVSGVTQSRFESSNNN